MLRALAQRALLLLLLTIRAPAQYTTGAVQGIILDPSGAIVAGANVVLTNSDTNEARTFQTAQDGIYSFAALRPGNYTLTVAAAGFAGSVVQITAVASETATRNLKLSLPSRNEAIVVVHGEAAQVDASEPTLSTTRNALEINNLPNRGRDVTSLVSLEPGVAPMYNPEGGGSLVKVFGAQTGQISANGGRPEMNNVDLDFTDANDWEFGGFALGTQPAPDLLEEVRVLTSNMSADYGTKAAGDIEMITKSGTNNWHGDAYDYVQNDFFNARDFFDTSGKATRSDTNNFGFSMGGPVVKNKTFLFGGWEKDKILGGGFTTQAEVPTARARAFATDPAIVTLMNSFLPAPTGSTSDPLIGTVSSQFEFPSDSHQYLLRGDQYFSPKHTVSLRYFSSNGNSALPFPSFNTLPGFDAGLVYAARNADIADTYSFTPSAVNQLRLAYARSLGSLSPENNLQSPRFNIFGMVAFGALPYFDQGRTFNVYQINDILSRVQGRHLLRIGFDARKIQDNSTNQSNDRGVYTFSSLQAFLAGQPFSWVQAFGPTELGFRTSLYSAFVQDDFHPRSNLTLNLGLRWEYQGPLTERNGLISVLDPSDTGVVGRSGTGPLGAFHLGNPAVNSNPANFSPRLGFAWNPNAGKLVVRGGYGIYYDAFAFAGLSETRTNPPLNYTVALAGTQISAANNFDFLLAGTAPVISSAKSQLGTFGNLTNFGSISTIQRSAPNPNVQQYDLTLEYRFSPTMVGSVAYVGSKGTHLAMVVPINQVASVPPPATSFADESARLPQFEAVVAGENGPGNNRLDPRFDQIDLNTDIASSTYNSMQVNFRKSLSRGFQLQASYSWSKSIDNSSSANPVQDANDNGFPQNSNNLALERAASNFDIRHRFVLTSVWDMPFFKGRDDWASHLLKGWTFETINSWQSGVPATILAGPVLGISDVNLDGNFAPSGDDNTRANCNTRGAFSFGLLPSVQSLYSQPLLGNDGNCGRNTARLPGIPAVDWAISKKVVLRESGVLGSGPWNLELRAEMYNVLNHPILMFAGDAWRTVASPAFGVFNLAGQNRRMQLAARLNW